MLCRGFILYALYFIIQSKTVAHSTFTAYAYGQQLYLQGFPTLSSFIVNLESSQFFSVITAFVNSRSRSSAILLTQGISFNLRGLGASVTVLATATRELLFQESLKEPQVTERHSFFYSTLCDYIPKYQLWFYIILTVRCPVSCHFSQHCNNFPFLVARVLKFGPEKIYLVVNMTKDSLIFCLCFHREIYIFRLLCCPVSGQLAQYPATITVIVHKFRQASDLQASLALAK